MADCIVGLTGGIGSGKSAASRCFALLGIEVIDADAIARELVAPGADTLRQLVDYFGHDALQPDGSLNRSWLRQRVFADATARDWLNNLLHPAIRQQLFHRARQAASPYALLEVPLLIENGLYRQMDAVVVVDVPEQLQIQRTCQRDRCSLSQVQAIMKAQASRAGRLTRADFVIDNSGTPEALAQQVQEVHDRLLTFCKNRKS